MQTTIGAFRGTGGVPIHTVHHRGESPAGAHVVIAHGLAEHSGRYDWTAERLVDAGYDVHALDHRGHGRSGGRLGYVDSFTALVDDLAAFVRTVKAEHRAEPVFLLGHSMGGLAVTALATRGQVAVDGIVLSGPALAPGDDFDPATLAAAKVLGRLTPGFGVQRLDAAHVSRDPEVVARYLEDPMNFTGKLPARTGAQLLETIERTTAQLGAIRAPLLVLHGSDDKLVPVKASEIVVAGVSSEDVTLKVYDGLYHEILNEPERDEVVADITAWLDTHR